MPLSSRRTKWAIEAPKPILFFIHRMIDLLSVATFLDMAPSLLYTRTVCQVKLYEIIITTQPIKVLVERTARNATLNTTNY
jgi:hypothetical protein